jgi:hypothetical protein
MAEEIIYPATNKRVWWGAIFAGSVVALVVSFMLGLLAITVGAATIDPSKGVSLEGAGTGALVSWLLITFLAYLAGGCVAGRLSGALARAEAVLHGIVTWGVVTIAVIVLVGSTSIGVLSGMSKFLAGGIPMGKNFAAQSAMNEPAGAGATASVTTPAPENTTPSDQSQQQATITASNAAQITSQVALWGLVALAVGGLGAWIGGAIGAPKRMVAVV